MTEVGAHRVVDEDNVDLWETDAPSGGEELMEVAGRSCYRSFRPGLNPNVSKVREGNGPYVKNIVRQGHGSVLQHATATFAFVGVSRVFTHELVRHGAGTGFSQESLRYVRLDELVAWYPESLGGTSGGVLHQLYDALAEKGMLPLGDQGKREVWVQDRARRLRKVFTDTFVALEATQREVANMLYLDALDGSFPVKKAVTSAMRRLAPMGLGTVIIATANHRAWRNIVEQRATPHAEEEIRIVIGSVARQLKSRFPNVYADMRTHTDGTAEFEHHKV